MKNIDCYAYSVIWSEEDGEYVGLCAQFPYLSFLAATPDAALTGVRESVAIALDMLAENGESAPPPALARSACPVCV